MTWEIVRDRAECCGFYVRLDAWQMRRMTREPRRVEDSARHANKSLLSISTGDVFSVFLSTQLLRFTVTHVSRTHCTLRCTVTECQLIISLLQCFLFVCAFHTHLYTFDICFQFIAHLSNFYIVAWQFKDIFSRDGDCGSLFLSSSVKRKATVSASYNTFILQGPLTDGETSVRSNMELLDCWQ